MTPELIGILAVGVALAGVFLVALRENTRVLRTEIRTMRAEMNKQFEALLAEIKAMREETKRRGREPTLAAAE